MFDTFREPHFFTFSVIFSHIASIFTFSVEIVSHLATFSHIAAFSHLRVPQGREGWVFQTSHNIFFSHFQGQNIFFQSIMGHNICSIQYKFGSNFVVEPRIGCKTIVLRACQFQIHCNTT